MRKQIEARQNRANTGSNWFRVGVLSATVVAPLIARWNDLRTSNRAQTLRELAVARLGDARDARDLAVVRLTPVRDQAVARLAPVREIATARLGDARDLASARLDDARVVANARLDDALDRLAQVRTPEMLQNMPPFSLARKRAEDLQRQRQRRQRQTMILWLVGVGVGLFAAGVTAFVVARRRMATSIDEDEPMVELPERNLSEATVGRAPAAMRNSYAATAERAEISVPVQTFTRPETAAASQAPYIGNTHTRVFHDADDAGHLPTEENRIYFVSEDEARQAGFRYSGESEDSPAPENQ